MFRAGREGKVRWGRPGDASTSDSANGKFNYKFLPLRNSEEKWQCEVYNQTSLATIATLVFNVSKDDCIRLCKLHLHWWANYIHYTFGWQLKLMLPFLFLLTSGSFKEIISIFPLSVFYSANELWRFVTCEWYNFTIVVMNNQYKIRK